MYTASLSTNSEPYTPLNFSPIKKQITSNLETAKLSAKKTIYIKDNLN